MDDSASINIVSPPILTLLQDAVGPEVVVSGAPADVVRHLNDSSGLSADNITPLGVAYPRTTEHVSAIIKFCNAASVPIVPQGGLTGMAGGALPVAGALLLSLERMRNIEEIDIAASTMTVQAGVPLQRIQNEAAEHGLMFPLDLGARGSCLIGGNISTNAGGNRVLRFGMTREMILGIEAVLADGTILSSLNKMQKNNAGYDLKQLFIGSEGTLGIVTRAVLRLFPASHASAVALCATGDYAQVLKFLRLARARLGGELSAFEVMWQEFYDVASGSRPRPRPLPATHNFYMLIEMLGADGDGCSARFNALIEEAYEKEIIEDAAIAKSVAEINEFWAIRDASGELSRLLGPVVNFDISIPVGKLADFAADCRVQLTAAIPDVQMLVFGHIADSNIHLACRNSDKLPPVALIEDVVYQCVRQWHGSVSAEHGIGLGKRKYLGYSRSAEEIALMKVLKATLDPKNILNPGKVLPD